MSEEITWPDGMIWHGSSSLHAGLGQHLQEILSAVAFTICCDNWWPWTDNSAGDPKSCLFSRQKPTSGRRRGDLVCFTFLSFVSGFMRFLFPPLNHIYPLVIIRHNSNEGSTPAPLHTIQKWWNNQCNKCMYYVGGNYNHKGWTIHTLISKAAWWTHHSSINFKACKQRELHFSVPKVCSQF